MTIFYIPNPTQYLNLTTTLLLVGTKQQIIVYWGKSRSLWFVNVKVMFLQCNYTIST